MARVPVCGDCGGHGTVAYRTCNHSGRCPCGLEEVDCPTCGGSGRPACQDCNQFDATRFDDDEEVCAACYAYRRNRVA